MFGAAIACFLTERKIGRVVLLERTSVAAGATGWSSGIIRVHYTNPYESRLALVSLEMFRNWAEAIGGSCGYKRTGFLRIVGIEDRGKLRQNIMMLRKLGANVEFLEPEELRRLQPFISIENVGGAAYEPDGGYGSGAETAQALVERAIARGAILRQGVEVRDIMLADGRAVGVETNEGFLPTGSLVVATGAWSIGLLKRAGVELPIRTKLVRAGLLQHAEDLTGQQMTIIDDSIGTYFRPERESRSEFGLRYEWDVDPDNIVHSVRLPYVADGAEHLVQRVPAFYRAGLIKGWAAPDGYSADGTPILGRAPGIENLFLAVAAGGTGFKIAPAVGLSMAELIAHGESVTIDITPFRATRFAEGEPISSSTDYTRPAWRDQPLTV